jgi:hypothetical protein
MIATTIDEVIEQLTDIIDRARREESRLGFFPALYRKVTIKVKEGIASGRFEDGPRMGRLDVIFANRYLDALARFRDGERPSECWLVAFQATSRWRLLFFQHLLLGVNAHINFDLGIAAAQTSPGEQLPSLEHDFDEINTILAGLVDQVQNEIDELSPWLGILDHIGGRTDEAIVKFSIDKARDAAWGVAQRLAPVSPDQWGPELDKLDGEVATLGRLVRNPGWFLNLGLLAIRLRESNDVPRIIDVLA